MRFITLDSNGIVKSVRFGKMPVENEIESEAGELGQRMLEDGTFVDVPVEPIEPKETLEEKITRLEIQLEEQSIVQLEVLATIFEELIMRG